MAQILFACVARGTTLLCQQATCVGNFVQVTECLLPQIVEASEERMTFSHRSMLIHYTKDGGLIVACVTDAEFPRVVAFQFLNELAARFKAQYGGLVNTALPYAMQSSFQPLIKEELHRFSTVEVASSARSSRSSLASTRNSERQALLGDSVPQNSGASSSHSYQAVRRVEQQMDEIRDILIRNLDQLEQRGEKLELLIDKTRRLEESSISFRSTARRVERAIWFKNVKYLVAVALVTLLLLYICVSAACGGLSWPNCVSH